MDGTLVVGLFVTLFLKHFVVDFLLQGPFQYRNKHNFLHLGGYVHAGIHGLVTISAITLYQVIFVIPAPLIDPNILIQMALIETILHFLIDLTKMRVNQYMGWGALTHEQFWWLLGLDQLLHSLTYAGMVYVWIIY